MQRVRRALDDRCEQRLALPGDRGLAFQRRMGGGEGGAEQGEFADLGGRRRRVGRQAGADRRGPLGERLDRLQAAPGQQQGQPGAGGDAEDARRRRSGGAGRRQMPPAAVAGSCTTTAPAARVHERDTGDHAAGRIRRGLRLGGAPHPRRQGFAGPGWLRIGAGDDGAGMVHHHGRAARPQRLPPEHLPQAGQVQPDGDGGRHRIALQHRGEGGGDPDVRQRAEPGRADLRPPLGEDPRHGIRRAGARRHLQQRHPGRLDGIGERADLRRRAIGEDPGAEPGRDVAQPVAEDRRRLAVGRHRRQRHREADAGIDGGIDGERQGARRFVEVAPCLRPVGLDRLPDGGEADQAGRQQRGEEDAGQVQAEGGAGACRQGQRAGQRGRQAGGEGTIHPGYPCRAPGPGR